MEIKNKTKFAFNFHKTQSLAHFFFQKARWNHSTLVYKLYRNFSCKQLGRVVLFWPSSFCVERKTLYEKLTRKWLMGRSWIRALFSIIIKTVSLFYCTVPLKILTSKVFATLFRFHFYFTVQFFVQTSPNSTRNQKLRNSANKEFISTKFRWSIEEKKMIKNELSVEITRSQLEPNLKSRINFKEKRPASSRCETSCRAINISYNGY